MATNKKAVMVYLPDHLEIFVSEYCLKNGITIEKDGEVNPRMGTGIIRLLESLVKGDSVTSAKSLSLSNQKVKDIETAIADLTGQLSEVMEEVNDLKKPELAV
jgi:peptidoglycan hydrolase CwlO-like protein